MKQKVAFIIYIVIALIVAVFSVLQIVGVIEFGFQSIVLVGSLLAIIASPIYQKEMQYKKLHRTTLVVMFSSFFLSIIVTIKYILKVIGWI